MKIAGQYVGLGLGDSSQEIRAIKAFMRRKFSYAKLADTPLYDAEMAAVVADMQGRYAKAKQIGQYIPGVINLETKYAMGYLPRPVKPKPIVITIEGHCSDMWVGPAANIGAQLEAEGLCRHQPIAYDRFALPFNNKSGIDEVVRILSQDRIGPNNSWEFPPDLPWFMLGFSQGAIIANRVWLDFLRNAPAGSRLAARRDRLNRVVTFGDPYREKNVCAEWVPDPPRPNTQGISDRRMDNTPPWWKVHSRTGDLYTENESEPSEVGMNCTAIYKVVSENSWVGGPASIFARLGLDFLADPNDAMIDIAKSIIGGAMFLGNMGPHGIYDLNPPTDYIRRGLRGEPQPK